MMLPDEMDEMFADPAKRAISRSFGPIPTTQPSTPVEQPNAMRQLRQGYGGFQRGAQSPHNFLQQQMSRIPLFGPLQNLMR